MLLWICRNVAVKLIKWLLELKKHCFIFKVYNIVCADKKSCFLCLNGPYHDITLRKYVIQLYNFAIAFLHIMYKNNNTKDDWKIPTWRWKNSIVSSICMVIDSRHHSFILLVSYNTCYIWNRRKHAKFIVNS